MTIVRAKRAGAAKDIENFIQSAPDAVVKGPGVKKGNKVQISLTIDPEQLDRVDQMAAKMFMARAALINMAINELLENGVRLPGRKD